MIPQSTREAIRKARADLIAAAARRQFVIRADGVDDQGHPGIEAANLEGYLGRFTDSLLTEIERLESACNDLLSNQLSTRSGGDPGMIFDRFDAEVERGRKGTVTFDRAAVGEFKRALGREDV